jgi:hypothetical protein
MPFLSAFDDFVLNSLGAVPGQLGKLLYVAKLRGSDGRYSHWGMARIYGEAAAQSSIQQAHGVVLSETLRQPVANLWKEVVSCSQAEGLSPADWLTGQLHSADRLVPGSPGAGSERHLRAVLAALSGLARAPLRPSPRDA